jgi:hypothetical protein
MNHQNFQEAIAQLSTEQSNLTEVKNQFNLNEEDMMAMKSDNSLVNSVARPIFLCCCCG